MTKKQEQAKRTPSRKSVPSADDLAKSPGIELSEQELSRVSGGGHAKVVPL